MVRLDSVWGIVGGRRPVKQLVKKVRMNSYCLSVFASNTAAVLGLKYHAASLSKWEWKPEIIFDDI